MSTLNYPCRVSCEYPRLLANLFGDAVCVGAPRGRAARRARAASAGLRCDCHPGRRSACHATRRPARRSRRACRCARLASSHPKSTPARAYARESPAGLSAKARQANHSLTRSLARRAAAAQPAGVRRAAPPTHRADPPRSDATRVGHAAVCGRASGRGKAACTRGARALRGPKG